MKRPEALARPAIPPRDQGVGRDPGQGFLERDGAAVAGLDRKRVANGGPRVHDREVDGGTARLLAAERRQLVGREGARGVGGTNLGVGAPTRATEQYPPPRVGDLGGDSTIA